LLLLLDGWQAKDRNKTAKDETAPQSPFSEIEIAHQQL